jgi:hypothetical protein
VITYFQTIPSGAVRREVDGNLYAYSNLHLDVSHGRVTVKGTTDTRMLRVHEVHPTNGTATVRIGKAGDAIAVTANLPFSVTALHEIDQ